MANARKTVMVSSTARDLPEHRKEVMDACLRQGMFPVMMEHLPASDAEAISASLNMVDDADIYVGIFAHRYGYIPKENNPQQISVTEMEYNRAVERKIPRCIFIMHEEHPIKASDMDIENAAKLKAFKERVQKENIINQFKSPAELRGNVIDSLSNYRETDVTAFHYVSDIPQPPEAYIAHPYTLLQTHRLIGRQDELNLLTSWVTRKQDDIYYSRIMSVVAIGGMGKSALTWKWFNDIAPQEIQPLAGRMWWSFYESDATFENFVVRALAYISKRSREDIEKNTKTGEREEQLLQLLDREPYLIVLDGLERILIAYARMDAARLSDDDIDQRTANFVAKAYGLPESAAQSFVGQHLLRKTTDPRAGSFFRKLANIRSARILVSTRLYPADLQSVTGEPTNGCSAIFLPGLSDDDALNLWRAFKVSGSREQLLPLFNKFENHPLLMQSLASEMANYRRAPGDFEHWKRDHPNFDPFSLPMTQVKGHVLGFAIQGLSNNAQRVLETVAAFRMPAKYDTLTALFVGENKMFSSELSLDRALSELEDRGLVGWDKRANRYDLHPIVRGVVWGGVSDDSRNNVFIALQAHFESIPGLELSEVRHVDDLTPVIELYNTLIGLEQYFDAMRLFIDRLMEPMWGFGRLGANLQCVELLEMIPNDILDSKPDIKALHQTLLATNYRYVGEPQHAATLYREQISTYAKLEEKKGTLLGHSFLNQALFYSGNLRDSVAESRKAIAITREIADYSIEYLNLQWLGSVLASLRKFSDSIIAMHRSLLIFKDHRVDSAGDMIFALCSQVELWRGDLEWAFSFANAALELAGLTQSEEALIRAKHHLGLVALETGDYLRSDEYLRDALMRARAVRFVEEELPITIALAELRCKEGDFKISRELLDNVWEYSERGPYPLFHSDACNILAQIERDEGNNEKAIEAVTKAYRLAWCDGPPYAYHWGLEKAKKHLKELGAPEPEMLPYDESKFEPMPEVEINPKDEYWVDPDKEFDIDDLL